jgi:hypothetical protein
MRMNGQRLARRLSTSTVFVLAIAIAGPGGALAAAPDDARDIAAAKAVLADEYGGSPRDYVLEAERRIAADGRSFWAAKFSDSRSGTIRLVYRDDAGHTGGPEVLEAGRERSADTRSALERKASPELLDLAASARTGSLLPVAVWLDVDTTKAVKRVIAAHPEGRWSGDRPTTADAKVQDALQRRVERARARAYEAAARAALALVEADGGRLGYVSTLAPLAYIDTPVASLDELAASPRVRTMGLEGNAWSESMASAGRYVGASWHSGDLDRANGVRVGVIEYYNVRATGDLSGKVAASHSESGSTAYTPTDRFDHPTWVAGAIASQDATNRGVSPGALIVSSGTGGGASGLTRDRNVIRATDWAATVGGAHILNVSLNMDSTTGRDEARAYFDAIAGGEATRTVIASAGNWGTGVDAGTWLVSSPGTSWNVLTVGGVNDGTGRLWYDGSCPCSGALWDEDPDWPFNPHGDFNKPNVSAPAVNVETANGKRASGTSVAAPIVSGIAAQLFGRNPTTFKAWPEAMRAIIMASAHRRIPLPGGGTNTDHEGVGTVHALWAHRVYGNPTYGGWTKGTMEKGASVTKTFSVTAGQKVRIALAWDSHTTGTMFDRTDRLQADLDLVVTYPGGTRKSLSYDNANEFVSFQAPSSGTVSVRIAQSRFDGESEHWALAWLHW